jgi:PAS domain S-box-containing protein
MDAHLKILFIEDENTDYELIKHVVHKNKILFNDQVVETEIDYRNALHHFKPDLILSDYNLPLFNGMLALKIRQELTPSTPFILITGTNNEETAVEIMKAGADDYILKDNLTRLPQAIRAAILKHETIKSKKEAEEALLESNELFRTAFENAAIGVCMIDAKGFFVKVNSTFCNIIGYTNEEILGMSFNQITIHEDQGIGSSFLHQLNSGEIKGVSFEKRYLHKLGHHIWVNISTGMVYSSKTSSHYFVSYVQDISNRKLAEEQLKESLERTSTIIRTSPEAIMVTDENGTVELWNESAERIFGWKQEEILGKRNLIYHSNKLKLIQYYRNRIYLQKNVEKYELECLHKDGSALFVNFTASPLRNGHGEIVGILSMLEDITERKIADSTIKTLSGKNGENDHLLSETV